jgi:hypothetical protein
MGSKVVPGNAYFIKMLEGHELPKAMNGKYLKKYYPSMWQEASHSWYQSVVLDNCGWKEKNDL